MAAGGELWDKMVHMLLLQRGAAISTLQGAVFSSQILHFREKSFSGCSLYFHQHAKFSVEKIALSSAENSTCVLHLLEFFLVVLQPFLFQSTEFARRTLPRDASVLFHVKTFFPDHFGHCVFRVQTAAFFAGASLCLCFAEIRLFLHRVQSGCASKVAPICPRFEFASTLASLQWLRGFLSLRAGALQFHQLVVSFVPPFAENSTCCRHLLELLLSVPQILLFQSIEFALRVLQRDASVLFHVKTPFPDHLVIVSLVFRLRRLSLEGSCASALLDTDSISNESSLAAHSPWLSLVTRIESASTPSLLHRSEPSLESRGCSAQPANIAALDVTTALVEPFSGLPLLAELASHKLPQCATGELEAVWCSFRSGAESDSLSLGSAASAPFSEDRLVLAPTELACCFMSLSCCVCLCTYFVSRVYLFHECVFHFVSYC